MTFYEHKIIYHMQEQVYWSSILIHFLYFLTLHNNNNFEMSQILDSGYRAYVQKVLTKCLD